MAKLLAFSALVFSATALSGCASLGGNIKGSFDCRAPGGTCAPTSAIDAEATGQQSAPLHPQSSTPRPSALAGSTLRVVLAGYRDDDGRTHEARVVHIALPDPASAAYQTPKSTADIGKAIARGIGGHQDQGKSQGKKQDQYPASQETNITNPFPMPKALFPPLPALEAEPGVLPPGPEGSGVIAPLHDRTPHFDLRDIGKASQEELQP